MAVSHATGERVELRSTSEDVARPADRVLDATLVCLARWGLAKTTLDDIAREAGVSRATVYRLFPGGKPVLLERCGQREVARLLLELTERLDRSTSAVEVVADAIHHASVFLADHAALTTLLEREPEVLLPFLAFDRQGPLLAAASDFVAPTLSRFLPLDQAHDAVEWAARLVISFTLTPSESIDLTRADDARRVVTTYLLPGLLPDEGAISVPPPSLQR
jgi:AcrR family transcriptional regulator